MLPLQVAFNLVLAELSKILTAVTVAQSCQQLPGGTLMAEPSSPCDSKTAANPICSRTGTEENTDMASAPAKVKQSLPNPQARTGKSAVSKDGGEALLDFAAQDLQQAGASDGLWAAQEVKVDMAPQVSVSAQQEESATLWTQPRQDPAAQAQERAHEISEHEISGQMSDSATGRMPQNGLSAVGIGPRCARAKLPRLAVRSPESKPSSPDKWGQEYHLNNGSSSTALSPQKQQQYEVESDVVPCTLR